MRDPAFDAFAANFIMSVIWCVMRDSFTSCLTHILQAFLELSTEEAAMTMVNYYSAVTPHVRNMPVYIQYSNHKELKTDNSNQVMTD